MADRDWEKELAKIDKQLASISDEQLAAPSSVSAGGAASSAGRSGGVSGGKVAGSSAIAPAPTVSVGRKWTGWVKSFIALGAAVGMLFWPWSAQCGAPLMGYTAATGGVALLGVWAAVGTWRHRLALAHVLSLAVTAWGIVLGAREVLPRIGYAIPTEQHGSSWRCETPPASPAQDNTPDNTPRDSPVNSPANSTVSSPVNSPEGAAAVQTATNRSTRLQGSQNRAVSTFLS